MKRSTQSIYAIRPSHWKSLSTCISVVFFFFFFGQLSYLSAQQDPQYSQYMFNQLAINPAYAGSKEAISTAVFFRSQWQGIEGAPTTETVSIHSPIRKKNAALGFSVIADQIGPKKSFGALGSYAYRIKIKNGKLSFGLRFGMYQYSYAFPEDMYKDKLDKYNGGISSIIVPTADAGAYYYTNSTYIGASATHLYNGRLTNLEAQTGDNAKLSPHLFLTAGKAWEISEKLVFSPSAMVKTAANVPVSADLNLSVLLQNRLWLGLSLRSRYGVAVYTQFSINDKFKVGYAYELGINKAGRNFGGSHEIMISYDFRASSKPPFFSPRYF
ncbi:MAG: type IX secretion system membrane protein PorP/SprF [Bacteroidota bacterium]